MTLDQWLDNELITESKMNSMVDAINKNTNEVAQGLTSLVGMAYPATQGGMNVRTSNQLKVTLTIPDKINAIILDTESSNGKNSLTIVDPGDITLQPAEFIYINISNLSVETATFSDLAKLTDKYLIVGYNSYGYLNGPWAIYQNQKSTAINTSLTSWAYPIISETVKVRVGQNNSLQITLPSALETASDYTKLYSSLYKTLVFKVVLANGNETLTLANNQLLVLNIDTKTVIAVNSDAAVSLTDHYILLAVNHYGYLKGPWAIYQDEKTNSSELPDYYFDDDYIDQKTKTINLNAQMLTGTNFMYFTDSHWPDNNNQQINIMNYICEHTSVRTIFFGGDIPRAYGSEDDVRSSIDNYQQVVGQSKSTIHSVHGNHDFTIRTSSSSETGYTSDVSLQYSVLNQPAETSQCGIAGKNYYYVDNPVQKVRYIIIDDWEGLDTTTYWGVKATITQEQIDWLLNVAMNVTDYTFVIFTHAPSDSTLTSYMPTNDVIQQLLIAINNRGKFEYNKNNISVSADFSNTTNYVAIHLCGHNHRDQNHIDQKVLSVSSICDALYNNDENYVTPRTRGTINEQCVNIVSLNTAERTIKICRIGAGNGDFEFNY